MRSRTFIFKGHGKGRDRVRDVDLRITNIHDTVNKYLLDVGSRQEHFHLSMFGHLS